MTRVLKFCTSVFDIDFKEIPYFLINIKVSIDIIDTLKLEILFKFKVNFY